MLTGLKCVSVCLSVSVSVCLGLSVLVCLSWCVCTGLSISVCQSVSTMSIMQYQPVSIASIANVWSNFWQSSKNMQSTAFRTRKWCFLRLLQCPRRGRICFLITDRQAKSPKYKTPRRIFGFSLKDVSCVHWFACVFCFIEKKQGWSMQSPMPKMHRFL